MLRCSGKFVWLLLLLAAVSATAQITGRRDKKTLFKADNAFDFGDYLKAMQLYKSLYHLDSMGSELNYKLGVCHYEIKKFREGSKKYFERVAPDRFPEVRYYLGRLYHLDSEFDNALFQYHEYLKKPEDKEHTVKEIEDLIEKCHTAEMYQSKPDKSVKIENLGPTINTEYAEYAPLIPAEENFLIFTSRRKNFVYQALDPLGDYFEDIYVSKKIDSVWQAPTLLDTGINKPYHDAATGLSADGEKLLSYHTSPDHIHGHIYESKLKDGKWTAPEILNANVNSESYIETSACYSPDGEIIFFSSNRPGGYGGKDLYSVKRLPNGQWGMPYNLGPAINTEYNEDAPFVHPSDNILFFSSEGHKNMGGYDVFKSKYDEQEKFTTPENLRYPVNTVDDDIFFVLNTDASRGYFSSKRDGGLGSYDIYSVFFAENNIPLSVYNIHVRDEENNIIREVEVRLTDKEEKVIVGEYRSNKESGKVLIISKPNKVFRVTIEAKGYEPLILNSVLFDKETSFNFRLVHKHHD
jgi:hypothetical protein